MSLACSQARLLTLTSRKADCEYNIAIDAAEKMALAREQTELASEYNSKLRQARLCYYANGKYNNLDYGYLMGGTHQSEVILKGCFKSDSSMILTDYNGRVVLNNTYATVFDRCGLKADKYGRGETFSKDLIPKLLADLYTGYEEQDFKDFLETGTASTYTWDADYIKQSTGEYSGNSGQITVSRDDKIKALIDFTYPILLAAATNGWTTEYIEDMKVAEASGQNYIGDAINSGVFQLAKVTNSGKYDYEASLSYFVTARLVEQRNDSAVREEITAWYEAEKARIGEKEDSIDLDLQNLSTELEAIKQEITAVESLIDDANSVFEWGT